MALNGEQISSYNTICYSSFRGLVCLIREKIGIFHSFVEEIKRKIRDKSGGPQGFHIQDILRPNWVENMREIVRGKGLK